MLKLKAVVHCKLQYVCSMGLPDCSAAVQGQQGSNANRDTGGNQCPALSFCGVLRRLDPQDSLSQPAMQPTSERGVWGPWVALKCYEGQRMLQSGYAGLTNEHGQCPIFKYPNTPCRAWWWVVGATGEPNSQAPCWLPTVEWCQLKNTSITPRQNSYIFLY